jgi:hypothetical protein
VANAALRPPSPPQIRLRLYRLCSGAVPLRTTADGIVVKPAVLVHCFKGISHFPSVVIACVMRDMKLLYHEATKSTKQGRSCIWPNSGFVEHLSTRESCDCDVHLRDEVGMAIELKGLYRKAKCRWGIVAKQKKPAT